jgi:hypothetical protein
MDSGKLNNWIQSITGIAVVIGIGLVILELQQNREATMSQLSSEAFQMISQFHTSVLGDQPAEALAKACEQPKELTTEELVVLDHYYSDLVFRTTRVRRLGQRGGFYGEDEWKNNVGQWNLMFETPAGRAYWKTFPHDSDLREVGDQILASWNCPTCSSLYASWRDQIGKEAEEE